MHRMGDRHCTGRRTIIGRRKGPDSDGVTPGRRFGLLAEGGHGQRVTEPDGARGQNCGRYPAVLAQGAGTRECGHQVE